MVYFEEDGLYGFKRNGKVVITAQYAAVISFSNGLAAVGDYENGKWGFIDKTGNQVIALQYDTADSFSEGLSSVKKDGKYGFIDKTGKQVIALQYDDAKWFSEGLAAVKHNGKWGFIDKKGNQVIALQYDDVGWLGFIGNSVKVKKDRFFGLTSESFYINKQGKRVD